MVVHTYSGYENKVRSTWKTVFINAGIQEIVVSLRLLRKRTERENNLQNLPRYVIVK